MPFLKSKRFDEVAKFDTPELHWDFYDSFHGASLTQSALTRGENSTGVKLDKYLKLHAKRPETPKDVKKLPSYLEALLSLQNDLGQWKDLNAVRKALELPQWITIPDTSELDCATAFGIAIIRQHNEFFDLLQEAHDKATIWISSNELIYVARDLIVEHFGTAESVGTHCNTAAFVRELHDSTSNGLSETCGDLSVKLDGDSETSSSNLYSSSPLSLRASFDEKLRSITPQKDINRISACRDRLERIKMELVEMIVELEENIKVLNKCTRQCVADYNAAETVRAISYHPLSHRRHIELVIYFTWDPSSSPSFFKS